MAKLTAPTRSPAVEQMLAAKEFTWTYIEGVPLDQFDEEASLANQARVGKPVDHSTVDRYTTALGNGDIFPAIVAAERPRRRLLVVDGNHRLQAHKARGLKAIDAYVIRGASSTAVTVLTYEANTKHGLPSTEQDRLHQALYLMDAGVTADDAARRLGLKVSTLRTAVKLAEVNRRAADSGINEVQWDRIVQVTRLRLHQITMNDAFAAMALLTIDAGLSNAEVSAAVTDVTALRSVTEQLKFIEGLRISLRDKIQSGGIRDAPKNGRQVRSSRMILAMGLGTFGTLPDADVIVEKMTDDDKLHYLGKVECTIKQLSEIRDALKK